MSIPIPQPWHEFLADEINSAYYSQLMSFVDDEYDSNEIFPPKELVFNAFSFFPPEGVKVVILGQDPYHDVNQAHGLCFSVNEGVKIPPSLANIYREIAADMGVEPSASGNLERWANQGVLLLNATLTVRAHQAASHQNRGWERFTDAVIEKLASKFNNVVFILWGSYAQKKAALIDHSRHLVLKSAHPSPLSAYRGFLGNKHFSQTNDYLLHNGKEPVVW